MGGAADRVLEVLALFGADDLVIGIGVVGGADCLVLWVGDLGRIRGSAGADDLVLRGQVGAGATDGVMLLVVGRADKRMLLVGVGLGRAASWSG